MNIIFKYSYPNIEAFYTSEEAFSNKGLLAGGIINSRITAVLAGNKPASVFRHGRD